MPRLRSPGYPAVNLQAAVQYATIIYEKEKRSSVPTSIIAKHCGTKIKSSKGLRLLATFGQFGLIESTGEGEDRHIRLSSRALDIIVSTGENDPKRRKAIAQAALHPKVHKTIWDHYQGSLPSDDALRVYLIRDLEFQDDKVPQLIKEFRATLAFAGLLDRDIIDDSNGLGDADDSESIPEVGDYVQWTSQGINQFSQPKVVVGISEDGEYAFVDGKEEGVPMDELLVQDQPAPKTEKPPPANPFFQTTIQGRVADARMVAQGQVKASIAGEVISDGPYISFPLPGGNMIEIRLRSKVSKKDFGRIKALLDLSEGSLVDDDPDEKLNLPPGMTMG